MDPLTSGADRGAPPEWSAERRGEVEAIMRLQSLPGVGTRTLWRVLDHFGSGVAALEAAPRTFDEAAGSRLSAGLRSRALTERVSDAMHRLSRLDIQVLTWCDAHYPEELLNLADPPALLFCRGDLGLLASPAVTIVGSRRSTSYGRRIAAQLSGALVSRGVVVLSGLALGIDGAAHRGALEANGDTIAVLGSGVDVIQPASHRALGQRIAREGLLVSEFLPGEPAQAHHFPRRNRILAALGVAVVVVEAGERSGAFITVEHGLDLGRDVYAVPGPIDAPQSRGANALLQQGAHVVASVSDFADRFRPSQNDRMRAAARADVGGCAAEPQELNAAARTVWTALGDGPIGVDELARTALLDSAEVLVVLTELELGGWVSQEAGMRFRKAS